MNLEYCEQSIDIIIDLPLKYILSTAKRWLKNSLSWNLAAIRNSYTVESNLEKYISGVFSFKIVTLK